MTWAGLHDVRARLTHFQKPGLNVGSAEVVWVLPGAGRDRAHEGWSVRRGQRL
jgi:hypothetical protein